MVTVFDSILGDAIKEKRIEKGLSQCRVAHMLGMSQSAYSRLERGIHKITVDGLHTLSSVVGFNAGKIVNGAIRRFEAGRF